MAQQEVEISAWQELVDTLKILPKQEQIAMSLRYEHDMSDAEIAAVLAISPTQLKLLFEKAFNKLTGSFEQLSLKRV